MRVLFVGAGAVGGYIGGRLLQAGVDVTFLVRPRRKLQLTAHGLQIRSVHGDLGMPVPALTRDEVGAHYDVIVLTCKSYDLDACLADAAPAMAPGAAVLPLLNGMGHLADLDARFGASRVLGGSCSLSATLLPDGTIKHLNALQSIVFGARATGDTSRAADLRQCFAATSLDWRESERIEQDMWEKLVLIVTMASMNCLLRSNIADVLRAPGGEDAMRQTLETAEAIAEREGFPVRDAARQRARALLFDRSNTSAASMLRDLENRERVEADHIIGWMLGRAQRHGINAPVLSLAYAHLKAYEWSRLR